MSNICTQCPLLPKDRISFININRTLTITDCYCGSEAVKLIHCDDTKFNPNFPYEGCALKTDSTPTAPGTKTTATSTPTTVADSSSALSTTTLFISGTASLAMLVAIVCLWYYCRGRSTKASLESSPHMVAVTNNRRISSETALTIQKFQNKQSRRYKQSKNILYGESRTMNRTLLKNSRMQQTNQSLDRNKNRYQNVVSNDDIQLQSPSLSKVVTNSVDNSIFFFSDSGFEANFIEQLYSKYFPANLTTTARESHFGYDKGEIDVTKGDEIIVQQHGLEGWCMGENLTTGKKGKFPIYCLRPVSNVTFHFVNCFTSNSTMENYTSVKSFKQTLDKIVHIHNLDLIQLLKNESEVYPVFGNGKVLLNVL
ncbi:hypothetical protein BC833DRAFT_662778 [Globomyces pollinis-pini]|nr:hypothetical protein BC833DRAFT_662778 [Globomyces pollinis-pini]